MLTDLASGEDSLLGLEITNSQCAHIAERMLLALSPLLNGLITIMELHPDDPTSTAFTPKYDHFWIRVLSDVLEGVGHKYWVHCREKGE